MLFRSILLAELSEKEVFYAATIDSGLSRYYEKNQAEKVKGLALVKQKGNDEAFLQVLLEDDSILDLRDDIFCVLFHLPSKEADSEDYVLIFNHPNSIGKGAHYQIFLSDKREQNAIALFWLVKDFVHREEA